LTAHRGASGHGSEARRSPGVARGDDAGGAGGVAAEEPVKKLNGIVSRFMDGVFGVTRFIATNHDVDGKPVQLTIMSAPTDADGNIDPDSPYTVEFTDLRLSIDPDALSPDRE
jgi:hypothetical protein